MKKILFILINYPLWFLKVKNLEKLQVNQSIQNQILVSNKKYLVFIYSLFNCLYNKVLQKLVKNVVIKYWFRFLFIF